MKVGIIAFQGGVIEHANALEKLKVTPIMVRGKNDLNQIDGIIIPGGESTTISKLLKISGLEEPLKKAIQNGLPCYGTCAGMIILAKKIIGETPHLGLMDIEVRRNAYGRQSSSFRTNQVINSISDKELPLVFIRAPWIENVGEKVKILFTYDNKIVMAQEGNILVSSFHPELTDDLTVHTYFINMIKEYQVHNK